MQASLSLCFFSLQISEIRFDFEEFLNLSMINFSTSPEFLQKFCFFQLEWDMANLYLFEVVDNLVQDKGKLSPVLYIFRFQIQELLIFDYFIIMYCDHPIVLADCLLIWLGFWMVVGLFFLFCSFISLKDGLLCKFFFNHLGDFKRLFWPHFECTHQVWVWLVCVCHVELRILCQKKLILCAHS